MSANKSQLPMVWPVERTEDGEIVEVRIYTTHRLTRKGFAQLKEYLALWERAWYPTVEAENTKQDAP